ncbi:MAG TPA: hypothetical protein VF102_01370 [Gemmatimonadaceae bacterium]
MPGPFDPVPFSTYQGAGAGAAQGLSALAQAFLARRQLGLQKQQFQLQQAEAGYQAPHQEQVYTPGRLSQPSMIASENVPTTTPGVSSMGGGTTYSPGNIQSTALSAGSPDAMARTTGSYKTVNIPGYYDITKSLPYAQAELNGRLLAAIYGSNARVRMSEERYGGGVDENGNPILGSDYYARQALLNQRLSGQMDRDKYLYGGTGAIDPSTGQPIGAKTESTLVSQAPALKLRADLGAQSAADRARSLGERMRHNAETERATAVRAAQQAVDQDTRTMPKAPPFGFLSPADSAGFAGRSAAARAQLMTDRARLDSLSLAPLGGTAPGSQPFSSGASTAPHVPRSGPEASSLVPHRGPLGTTAPTATLGSRQVADASTTTYPKATNLPKSPGDPTVPGGRGGVGAPERAMYDAAVRRIVQNVSDPAEQARQFAKAAAIYQQRTGQRTGPQ